MEPSLTKNIERPSNREYGWSLAHLIVSIFPAFAVIAAVTISFGYVMGNMRDAHAQGTFRTDNLTVDNTATVGSALDIGATSHYFPRGFQIGQFGGSGNSTSYLTTSSPVTTTQLYIQENPVGDGAPHTAYESINLVADQRADYDTTAQPSSCNAITALANCNHVAGANALTTSAIICSAEAGSGSGDGSYCLYGPSGGGAIRVDDGASFGPTTVSSLSSLGAVTGTGATFSGNVALNTIAGNTTVNGNLTVASTEKINDLEMQFVSLVSYIYNASGGNEPMEISSAGATAIDFQGNNASNNGGTLGLRLYGGNNSGVLQTWFNGDGHILTGGTAPAFGTCGTGTPACVANSPCTDAAARVTTGATNTGCTITFAHTYAHIPSCQCTDETVSTRLVSCIPTATTLVMGLSANSNDVISYSCVGDANGGQ